MTDSFSYDSKQVLESYKVWRKNVPYNYDLLLSHSLTWPSLTVQFFPAVEKTTTGTIQNVLLSTHTSQADREYLTIAAVSLPDVITDSALEKFNHSDVYGDAKVKIVQQIAVCDEINRARISPFALNVIAARSDKPDIHIYDTTKHRSFEESGGPDLVLTGHKSGGFGISWSTIMNGYLATAGEEGKVCLYDINKEIGSKSIEPLHNLDTHSAVNDCFFSYFGNSFAIVGDDKKISIFDTRDMTPRVRENAHSSDILCVAYSPVEENFFATGAKDGLLKIWDERKLDDPVYVFETGSDNEVLNVAWSPHLGGVLACGGSNKRVSLWDITRVGMELSDEDKLDGPPELLFLHGGHTDTVCDIAWNPMEPYEIASVAEDNILQVWQMTNSSYVYADE